MRDRLIEILNDNKAPWHYLLCPANIRSLADYLLANGVIVTPCVAMVEQVIKDGKIDSVRSLHYAGKYAVVYVDKSKWNCPLIDITEQYYNTEKALERIRVLKGGASNEISAHK